MSMSRETLSSVFVELGRIMRSSALHKNVTRGPYVVLPGC